MLATSKIAFVVAAHLAAAALLAARAPGSSQAAPVQTFPEVLERYLAANVQPTALERSSLLAGSPVAKLLDADASKEVAVFGAVWINALPADYVRRVTDIENFERGGGFRVTRRISSPPRLEDFAALELADEDIQDLKNCRVGDCELKLSQDGVDRVRRSIDWSKPTVADDVEALARQIALEYVAGYLEGGNDRLAVYRDGGRPTFVATEFRLMVDRMPSLLAFGPDFRTYLLEFPKATLANATSFLYWQEALFGLKPTIRINHLVIQQGPDAVVVANKQLYASHYFWTALELRVLLPDPRRGRGFWFVNVNRSRSDGLSGFVGRVIRGRVQNEARKGVESGLLATKAAIERR